MKIKKILSHLEYRNKLRLVSYNKKIQKKLKLNINDYKNESKREIIGERNGKGKEYKLGSNILIFEGEYKDGKRNGKGKEYHINGQLKFEGQYLDSNKIKGKEYYSNGKLKYEGEYLFKEKWKGKYYDENGNIIYEINDGTGKIKEIIKMVN